MFPHLPGRASCSRGETHAPPPPCPRALAATPACSRASRMFGAHSRGRATYEAEEAPAAASSGHALLKNTNHSPPP
eukprot:6236650-Pyramimonas_sp.AAC.1